MMSKGHFLSGVSAGLLTAPPALELTTSGPATPATIVARSVAYSAVVGIGALWPDIDHPPAFISKVAGPVSWLLNKLFMWISHVVYQATRTEKDRPEAIHRTFTHTNFGTLLTGGAVYAGLLAGHVFLAPLWALAFTVGCLCHIWFIGDACTLSGVPHPLCPLVVIDGKRWSTVGFPRWMRFRAGGVRKGEKVKIPFTAHRHLRFRGAHRRRGRPDPDCLRRALVDAGRRTPGGLTMRRTGSNKKRAKTRREHYRPEGHAYWEENRGGTQRRDVVMRHGRMDWSRGYARVEFCDYSSKPIYDTADAAQAALDGITALNPDHNPGAVYKCVRQALDPHYHYASIKGEDHDDEF